MLVSLPDHAGVLLDAVVTRLETEPNQHLVSNLCAVLGAWGPAATVAAPVLDRLLFRPATCARRRRRSVGSARRPPGPRTPFAC
ncbi:hypothetical protein [Actinophytocola sp. NPDC049390]|uniref:hypothetical protein n=1 Tax=Actinophytocola sp. NPDC049390 TaxID=3363894 RepID=UPI0037A36FE9